jgi:hypothetical protein
MGFRQPNVQRHQPRFCAEAEQGEQERRCRPRGREMGAAHGIEGELPTAPLHHTEGEQ